MTLYYIKFLLASQPTPEKLLFPGFEEASCHEISGCMAKNSGQPLRDEESLQQETEALRPATARKLILPTTMRVWQWILLWSTANEAAVSADTWIVAWQNPEVENPDRSCPDF